MAVLSGYRDLEAEIRKYDASPHFGRKHNEEVLQRLRILHGSLHQNLVEACRLLDLWSGHLRPNTMAEPVKNAVKESNLKLRNSVISLVLAISGTTNSEGIDQTIEEACEVAGVPLRVCNDLRNGVRRRFEQMKSAESPYKKSKEEIQVGSVVKISDHSLDPAYQKGTLLRVMQEVPGGHFCVQLANGWGNGWGNGWDVPFFVAKGSVRALEEKKKKHRTKCQEIGVPPGLLLQPACDGPQDEEPSSNPQGGSSSSDQDNDAEATGSTDQESERNDQVVPWRLTQRNTFYQVEVDASSEASREAGGSHAKTEPVFGHPRPNPKAKTTRMKVNTWLKQLQEETEPENIVEIVREIGSLLGWVSEEDPSLFEVKHRAVTAVKGLLIDTLVTDRWSRWEVMMQLCMMTGPKFVSLELGSLVELQAEAWAAYLRWFDEEGWLKESALCSDKVVKDTINMSLKAANGRLLVSVMQATQKLICNFAKGFSDEFVKSTGAWLLKQIAELYRQQWSVVQEFGVRGFCALFRYKEHREIFGFPLTALPQRSVGEGFREDVEKLVQEMQILQQQSPEEHSFDEITRVLVYTHPLSAIAERAGSHDNKLKATLKEIFAFFCLQKPGRIRKDLQALGESGVLDDTHASIDESDEAREAWSEQIFSCLKDQTLWPHNMQQTETMQWFLSSWIVSSLFGPKVVATFATQRAHQHFLAEDSMFFHTSRGLQQWHQQAKNYCGWDVRKFVVQKFLAQSEQQEKDNCGYLGIRCNWSAFVGIIGEFLAGYAWPEHGTPDEHREDQPFLRQVDSALERVLCTFKDTGKLRDFAWGPFWREGFWSLQAFYSKTGLRPSWSEFVREASSEMQESVDEYLKDISEHRLALECAHELLNKEADGWTQCQSDEPYHEQYEW